MADQFREYVYGPYHMYVCDNTVPSNVHVPLKEDVLRACEHARGRAAYNLYMLINRRPGTLWGVSMEAQSTHFRIVQRYLTDDPDSIAVYCTHGDWYGQVHFTADGESPTELIVIGPGRRRDAHTIGEIHLTQLDIDWWRDKALETPPTWDEELSIIETQKQKAAADKLRYDTWLKSQIPL